MEWKSVSTTLSKPKSDTYDTLLRDSLLSYVRARAHGNGVKSDDVSEKDAKYLDVPVTVELQAHGRWEVNPRVVTGARLQNRTQHSSVAAAKSAAEKSALGLFSIPKTTDDIRALVLKNPDSALKSLGSSGKFVCVASSPTTCAVVNCDNCRGNGNVTCSAYGCSGGKVKCSFCNGHGKRTCFDCNGVGQKTEIVNHRNFDGTFSSKTVNYTCRTCNGIGRSGMCGYCSGSGTTDCMKCRGSGRMDCNPCDATGRFTHVFEGSAGANISIACNPDSGAAPYEFGLQLSTLNPRTVPFEHASRYTMSILEPRGDMIAGIRYVCQMPYRFASLSIGKSVKSSFGMMGKGATLTSQEPFLDELLSPIADYAEGKSSTPHGIIGKLQETRVGEALIQNIGSSGIVEKKDELRDAVMSIYSGSISSAFTERLVKAALKSYHGVGQKSSSSVWLKALFPILLISLWVNFRSAWDPSSVKKFHVLIPPSIGDMTGWFLVLIPVIVTRFYAGRKARKAIRAITGNTDAKKTPKQGMWPYLVVLLVVVLRLAMDPVDLLAISRLGLSPIPWNDDYMFTGGMLHQFFRSFGIVP